MRGDAFEGRTGKECLAAAAAIRLVAVFSDARDQKAYGEIVKGDSREPEHHPCQPPRDAGRNGTRTSRAHDVFRYQW